AARRDRAHPVTRIVAGLQRAAARVGARSHAQRGTNLISPGAAQSVSPLRQHALAVVLEGVLVPVAVRRGSDQASGVARQVGTDVVWIGDLNKPPRGIVPELPRVLVSIGKLREQRAIV